MTKKSKLVLAMASMLGVTAGATAVSGFAWFTTTKAATLNVSNIGVYSKSSALAIEFAQSLMGCEESETPGSVTVKAKGAQIVDEFVGNNSTKSFTLKETPHDKPSSVKVDNVTMDSGWSVTGNTITFTDTPAANVPIQVTYNSRKVLTDLSSIDGQNIYKPVWTATGEGQYATGFLDQDDLTAGYLAFTVTLSASGSSGLEVFLNHPTITGATDGTADTGAANIARVAVIEDETDTTRFVLQNNYDPQHPSNNVGIAPANTLPGAKNVELADPVDGVSYDGYDLSKSSATTAVPTLTPTGSDPKDSLSSAPDHTESDDIIANNYVTHIDAGGSKDVRIVVWLEGTSYNNTGAAHGAYTPSILDGIFSVNLPFIAF